MTATLTLLWGTPVPYSATVQRAGRTLSRLDRRHLEAVEQRLLALDAPAYIERVEGGYVWYAIPIGDDMRPIPPLTLSLRAIDIGFDPRLHPEMHVALPSGARAYRVLTDHGEVVGAGDYVLERLRRLGWRVGWDRQ
jgi:hypothetical protein